MIANEPGARNAAEVRAVDDVAEPDGNVHRFFQPWSRQVGGYHGVERIALGPVGGEHKRVGGGRERHVRARVARVGDVNANYVRTEADSAGIQVFLVVAKASCCGPGLERLDSFPMRRGAIRECDGAAGDDSSFDDLAVIAVDSLAPDGVELPVVRDRSIPRALLAHVEIERNLVAAPYSRCGGAIVDPRPIGLLLVDRLHENIRRPEHGGYAVQVISVEGLGVSIVQTTGLGEGERYPGLSGARAEISVGKRLSI